MQLDIFEDRWSPEHEEWWKKATAANREYSRLYDQNDNNPHFDAQNAWERIANKNDLPIDRDIFGEILFQFQENAPQTVPPLKILLAEAAVKQQPENFQTLRRAWHNFHQKYAPESPLSFEDLWNVFGDPDAHHDLVQKLQREKGAVRRTIPVKKIQQLVEDFSLQNVTIFSALLQNKFLLEQLDKKIQVKNALH